MSNEIAIKPDTALTDIQKEFNACFPFLNIEFSAHAKGLNALRSFKLNPETTINKIIILHEQVLLNIGEERTVAEVEKDFREKLGLNVQIFRKSGKVWNVITLTDSWTLKSQNKAAEFISTEMTLI